MFLDVSGPAVATTVPQRWRPPSAPSVGDRPVAFGSRSGASSGRTRITRNRRRPASLNIG